jgi:CRISPR-associated protein Csd1
MILQSLVGFYDRLERRGDAARRGYMPVQISFVVPINPDGTVERRIDLREKDKNRLRPVVRRAPKVRDHNNSGKDPFLFWDNTGYALGLSAKPMKRGSAADQFNCFKAANLTAIEGAICPELDAFRNFLERWNPADPEAIGLDPDDYESNVVFRRVGSDLLVHQSNAAAEVWARQIASANESRLCLVTGANLPIERLHPKFPSLEAGGSRGPLVSFNADAFESYGKEQGANAPVSEDAAFRYGAALEWLLDRSNSRSFRLGETTLVFWADEKVGNQIQEDNAQDVEQIIWDEFVPATRDADAENADTIRTDGHNIRTQRQAPDRSALTPDTRMFILGLSPNSGRIAVRLWLDDTYGHFKDNIDRHHLLMEIEPPDKPARKKPYALLYETAVLGKSENIPSRLGGELARAILTGSKYPRTLFTSVIGRMRTDKTINAARAGLCKAIINRDIEKTNRPEQEKIPVALDPESTDPAYNLGRLFATYEYAESAVAKRNATIRDKFIGAASATPRRVFPLLMRGYEHNASALNKGDGNQRGSAVKASKVVGQILERFNGGEDFPTSLALEHQGRFFVGYYHQNRALYTGKANAEPTTDTTDEEATP